MANPPDKNDNEKKIKTDRNLAKPTGVRPPNQDRSTEGRKAPANTGTDATRPPRTENLAAASDNSSLPKKDPRPVPKSTSAPQSRLPTAAAIKAGDGAAAPSDRAAITGNMPPKLPPKARAARPRDIAERQKRPNTSPYPGRESKIKTTAAVTAAAAGDVPATDTRVRSRLERPVETTSRQPAPSPRSRRIDDTQSAEPRRVRSTAATGRRLPRRAGPPHGHPDRQRYTASIEVAARPAAIDRVESTQSGSAERRAGPPPGHPARQSGAQQTGAVRPPISAERAPTRQPAAKPAPRRRMRPPVGARKVGRFLNRPAPVAAKILHAAPSSGGSIGPLLLGLLLLAVVGWLAIDHYTPTIQEDLLARSRASLNDAGLSDGTEVSIDGRNITISGVVSSQEESNAAEQAVADTFGVRSVFNELTIGEVRPPSATTEIVAPSFAITTDSDGITLSGAVSDKKFADALNDAAVARFGDAQINNEIEINTDATNPGWTAAVTELLPELGAIEDGALSISDGAVTLSGIAADAETKNAWEDKADALLGSQLEIVNQIESPVRSLPAFASITETTDAITLNGFMSADSAAAIAEAYQSSDKTVFNNISVNELAETPLWISNFNSAKESLQNVANGKLTIARSGNVKLQGSVESEAQKKSIEETVADLFGEETPLTSELTVVPPPVVPTMTPFVSIQQNADRISISGLLPQAAADQLLKSAGETGKSVVNNIAIDERVMQPEWTDALGNSLERLSSIENSSLNINSGGILTLKGDATTEQSKQFASINIRTLFGDSVSVENAIAVAPQPVVPSLTPFVAVRSSEDATRISGLLPEQTASNLLQTYASAGRTVIDNITVDERVIEPAWAEAIGESIDRLDSIDNAAINIASDGTLTLTGEAESEQVKQFTAINIRTLFGDSVSLRNDIRVKTPTIIEPERPDIGTLLAELDLSGIRFRSGSTDLDGDSVEILNEVVEVLRLSDDAEILIAGHTDSRGNADYNFNLSADRANAVQQYLINSGIPAERLTARGYGPTQPIASNDTAEGRALNRRIEIQLIGE